MENALESGFYSFQYTSHSFFNEYERISCVLKEEPEDFIVHEINDDKVEAELHDSSIPPPPIAEEPSSESIPVKTEGSSETPSYYSYTKEQEADMLAFFSRAAQSGCSEHFVLECPDNRKLHPDELSRLSAEYPYVAIQSRAGSVDFSRNPKADELIGIIGEKEALAILKFIIASRTSKEDTIHQYDLPSLQDKDHRRQFHLFIKLNYPFVSTKTEAGIISLTIRPSRKRQNRPQPNPRKRSRVAFSGALHFTLMKKNVEQLAFTTRLSQLLRVNEHAICFAGIKDKRAVTYQFGSVRGATAEALAAAVRDYPNVAVSDFHYEKQGLEVGHLWGNHFIITLRGIDSPATAVRSSLLRVGRDGFVNYFGAQRLGTRDATSSVTAGVGHLLITRQYKPCLQALLTPSLAFTDASSTEALECFRDCGDAKKAARALPPSAHNLHALLRGVHRYGCASILQSAAAPSEKEEELLLAVLKEIPAEMARFYVKALQSLLFNRVLQWRVEHFGTKVLVGDLVVGEEGQCRAVTEEDLAGNGVSVYDVVLPLFGWDVRLPENAVGEEYDRLLRTYLHCSMKELKKGENGFMPNGAYRSIAAKPFDLQYRFDESEEWFNVERDRPLDGVRPVLQLSFRLKKGLYATTMINEMTNGGAVETWN